MSNLTDAKTSLKKIISDIEEINRLTSGTMEKLISEPGKILELIEKFEEEKSAALKTIDMNTDEITTLKNKFSQNASEISKLEEEIEGLTKERQDLTDKIQSKQTELTNTQDKIKQNKEELEKRSNRLDEIVSSVEELNKLQEKFEVSLKDLEVQLQSEFDKKDKEVKSFKNRVAAIRSLINKDYIHTTELRVIKALQKDVTMEVSKLSTTLALRDDDIKKIMRKIMEANGSIEFNESAGTIILRGEVDV